MAEIVFLRHITTHPLSRVGERHRSLKRTGAVLRPVIIDQDQKSLLLTIEGRRGLSLLGRGKAETEDERNARQHNEQLCAPRAPSDIFEGHNNSLLAVE